MVRDGNGEENGKDMNMIMGCVILQRYSFIYCRVLTDANRVVSPFYLVKSNIAPDSINVADTSSCHFPIGYKEMRPTRKISAHKMMELKSEPKARAGYNISCVVS
jgi:hypothetical protein